MEIGEFHGPDADLTVNGNLHHALIQMFPAPRVNVIGQPDASLVHEHGDLPERDRVNRDFVRLPRPFYLPAGVVSPPAIAQPEP